MPHTPRTSPALDPTRPEPVPGAAGLGQLFDLTVPLTVWPVPVAGPAGGCGRTTRPPAR
jgi:hypothetical protein